MCLCDAKIESREGKNEKKKKKKTSKTNVEAGTVSAYRDKARAEPFI